MAVVLLNMQYSLNIKKCFVHDIIILAFFYLDFFFWDVLHASYNFFYKSDWCILWFKVDTIDNWTIKASFLMALS